MLPVIIGLIAAGLALAASKDKKAEAASKEKVKTPQEIFADGEKAGEAKAKASYDAERTREAIIRKTVRREMAYRPRPRVVDDDDETLAKETN